MSFYVSENTVGRIFDGNITNQQGELGETNSVSINQSGGVYRLKYSGNTAAEQIFPYVSWILNYTESKDYHHYLLLVDLLSAGSVEDNYQLYIDGEKQIIEEIVPRYATGSLDIPLTVGNFNSGELRGIALGSNLTRTNGLWNNGNKIQQLTGDEPSLLQFWFDFNVAYDFKESGFRHKFYPGKYVDLGLDGTATGLSQPKYYVGLRDYQDTLEQGSRTVDTLINWRWAQLENFGTVSGSGTTGYFNLNAFTASEAQNSTSANKNIVSLFEVNVTLIGVLLYGANLSATTAVSAEGTLIKGLSAVFESNSQQTAQAVKTTDVVADSVSEVTVSVDGLRRRFAQSDLQAESTVTAIVGQLDQVELFAFSEFTVAATTTVILPIPGQAQLSSEFKQTAAVTRIQPGASEQSSLFALTADTALIPPVRVETELTSTTALLVEAVKIVDFSAEMFGTVNLSVTPVAEFDAESIQTVDSTLEASAFKATGIAPTTLQVTAFTLTAGDVINFDPFLTLRVEQETRGLIIDPENRVVSIEQETRLNIIQGS
jgi:hypothetical protein